MMHIFPETINQRLIYLKAGGFSIVILFAFLCSCDTPISIDKVIYNNSDYDLKIYRYSEEQVIPGKSNVTIDEYRSYGRRVYETYNCALQLDSVRVVDDENLTLTKDFADNDNWMYTVLSKRTGECRLLITNADIN